VKLRIVAGASLDAEVEHADHGQAPRQQGPVALTAHETERVYRVSMSPGDVDSGLYRGQPAQAGGEPDAVIVFVAGADGGL